MGEGGVSDWISEEGVQWLLYFAYKVNSVFGNVPFHKGNEPVITIRGIIFHN